MMITIGGIAGALMFNIVANKSLYILAYVTFLLFSFITYLNLLQNGQRSNMAVLGSFLSSLSFGAVMFLYGMDFSNLVNSDSILSILILIFFGALISRIQINGLTKNKKIGLIERIVKWFY